MFAFITPEVIVIVPFPSFPNVTLSVLFDSISVPIILIFPDVVLYIADILEITFPPFNSIVPFP